MSRSASHSPCASQRSPPLTERDIDQMQARRLLQCSMGETLSASLLRPCMDPGKSKAESPSRQAARTRTTFRVLPAMMPMATWEPAATASRLQRRDSRSARGRARRRDAPHQGGGSRWLAHRQRSHPPEPCGECGVTVQGAVRGEARGPRVQESAGARRSEWRAPNRESRQGSRNESTILRVS